MVKRRIFACAVLALVAGAGAAVAQIPDLGGALPSLPNVGQTVDGASQAATQTLRDVRQTAIQTLRRRHGDVIDTDRNDQPVIRSEVVAIAPTPQALDAARALGFSVAETVDASGLGLTMVVLRAPHGVSTRRALETLRSADPEGAYDYNHIYLGAGELHSSPQRTFQSGGAGGGGPRIGLIDSGVDTGHPTFARASVQQRGFAAAQALADIHGTEVASLIVGDGGASPGASLYVADIYGGRPTGGGAAALVAAMAWLARSNVGVINISLVGPPNRALEAAVRAAIARGHVIVAAVGNDGPAAPPLYPAAYAGVIGVTGVDAHERVLPEAGRGAQVDFAAPGADMLAATPNGGYAPVRGTSFAAPIVAGLLARQLTAANEQAAARAEAALAARARDLGARGPDRIYGVGMVGEEVRASRRALARR